MTNLDTMELFKFRVIKYLETITKSGMITCWNAKEMYMLEAKHVLEIVRNSSSQAFLIRFLMETKSSYGIGLSLRSYITVTDLLTTLGYTTEEAKGMAIC